ncbi:alpha/beta hydrolase [Demequina maris]|uniref:alpha/beta hydrolase n=1 Tax=Demequina maris TaxID=1638982 RepID=UPI0007867A7E|nr:alpha/beta hydrolase-fold protein [Demequina maris]
MQADPANPAPVATDAEMTQQWSQVFVPADPARPTYDATAQVPLADAAERGTVEARTYRSEEHGERDVGVYLPPGYDPDGAEPYPLLVLSHGAGDDEAAWWTQGGAAQLLDHAIADGTIPPVVAITTDFSGLSEAGLEDPALFELYAAELEDGVLPYAAAQLHASTDPERRAFAGLSMGGRLAEHVLLTRPDLFAAYGMWSMPAGVGGIQATALTDAELADAVTARAVHLGTGAEDSLTPTPDAFQALVARYRAAGVEADMFATHGGHAWWVWRQMLGDFLATAAFEG